MFVCHSHSQEYVAILSTAMLYHIFLLRNVNNTHSNTHLLTHSL